MNDAELLDSFAAALRSEPPALDEAETTERVRAALAEADDEALVDAFADALRAEPPPAQGADAPAPPSSPASRRWAVAAVAASLVFAVGAGMWAQLLLSDVEGPGALVEHRLAAGHRIHATAAATLAIEERAGQVQVRLADGEALFDVRPGSSFVVVAGAHHVRVTGTVFTVRRDGDEVGVQVYEGSVEVERGDESRALSAGDRVGAPGSDRRIVSLAEASARRRLGQARASRRPPPADVAEPAPPGDRAAPEATAPEMTAPEVTAPEVTAPEVGEGTASTSSGEPARAGLDLDQVRSALATRRYARALQLLDRAGGGSVESLLLRGDALRGLARDADALAVYRRAVRRGSPTQRALAGLEAARLLAGPLGRPDDARAMLSDSGALADGSVVRVAARRLDARLETR